MIIFIFWEQKVFRCSLEDPFPIYLGGGVRQHGRQHAHGVRDRAQVLRVQLRGQLQHLFIVNAVKMKMHFMNAVNIKMEMTTYTAHIQDKNLLYAKEKGSIHIPAPNLFDFGQKKVGLSGLLSMSI